MYNIIQMIKRLVCVALGLFLLWLVSAGCAAGLLGAIAAVSSGSSGGSGSGSKTPVPIPTTPANLSGYAISPSEIRIDWDDSEYETGYDVERRLVTETYCTIISLSANTISYADIGLLEDTQYFYRIKAGEFVSTRKMVLLK